MTGHRLVVDIQTTQSLMFGERGIPRYTADLCRALLRAEAPVAALALNPNLPWPRHLHPELARSPLLAWNTSRLFQRLETGGQPLAYHVMSPYEGPRPVQSALSGYVMRHAVPLVVTVYDLIPDIFDIYPKGNAYSRVYRMRRDMIRRADLLLAISKSTRADAISWLGVDPDRVVDIGTGASEYFHPPGDGDRPAELLRAELPRLTRPFVMSITGVFGLDTRKNTEVLIEAYARLPTAIRRNHQLAVTCRITDADRKVWQQRGRELGLADDELLITGFVPDAVLRAMYQRAALFVYPSRYEGFGLPALEAARCGCPTITSNTSAMPEILEWEPATFGPDDTDGLAALMDRALTDEVLRTRLREVAAVAARRHTWDRVARRTIDAYSRLDRPRVRRRARTLQVALVGALPPSTSGVARFTAALAEELSTVCLVDCIYDQSPDRPGDEPHEDRDDARREADRRDRGYRAYPAGSFGRVISPAGYDAVFYAIADGPDHRQTWDLAFKWPGIAWLHTMELGGRHLDFSRFFEGGGQSFMRQAVRHQYKDRAPDHLFDDVDPPLWSSPSAYEQAGARMVAEVATRSRGVIVGSELARSALELDAGPDTRLPPTWVVPVASVLDLAPPAPETMPLVVALGPVDRSRAEVVLEAAAIVSAAVPLRVALVGEVDGQDRRHLLDLAGRLGLAGHVMVPGRQPVEAYAGWLARATVAVQLRPDASGGPWLALADAMAAGLPTITSASVAAELPAASVVLVPPFVTPAALATDLTRVLVDETHRRHLADTARATAAAWTISDVAEAILAIARTDAIAPARGTSMYHPIFGGTRFSW